MAQSKLAQANSFQKSMDRDVDAAKASDCPSKSKWKDRDEWLAQLYAKWGEVYITQDVCNECAVELWSNIDFSSLKHYLLKNRLGNQSQLEDISACPRSNQVDKLLSHVIRVGGTHAYFLLYVCLAESAEDEGHQSHVEATKILQEKAKERTVVAPKDILEAYNALLTQKNSSTDDSDSKGECESGYESSICGNNIAKERKAGGTLKFKCHTCCTKSCTASQYINGKACPESEKEIPFLHLEGESYESFQLEYTLQMHTKRLRYHYADLREDTFRRLAESKVHLDDVRQHVKRLVSPEYEKSVHGRESKHTIPCDIEHTTTYKELEDVLCSNYCSWFNYDVLKVIREKFLFCNSSEDEALKSYEDEFYSYCKHRCFESPLKFHPEPVSSHMKSLVFKIDEHFGSYTLANVHHMTATVASIVNIPHYAIYVRSVREGCIEVSCYVLPQNAEIHQLDEKQTSELKRQKIISFKIEDHELLSGPEIQDYESSESSDSEGYIASSEDETEEFEDTEDDNFGKASYWSRHSDSVDNHPDVESDQHGQIVEKRVFTHPKISGSLVHSLSMCDLSESSKESVGDEEAAITGDSFIQECMSKREISKPDKTLPHSSLLDRIRRYNDDLKARYAQQSVLPDSDWPPSRDVQYVRLALIKQERLQKDYTRGDNDKSEQCHELEVLRNFLLRLIDARGCGEDFQKLRGTSKQGNFMLYEFPNEVARLQDKKYTSKPSGDIKSTDHPTTTPYNMMPKRTEFLRPTGDVTIKIREAGMYDCLKKEEGVERCYGFYDFGDAECITFKVDRMPPITVTISMPATADGKVYIDLSEVLGLARVGIVDVQPEFQFVASPCTSAITEKDIMEAICLEAICLADDVEWPDFHYIGTSPWYPFDGQLFKQYKPQWSQEMPFRKTFADVDWMMKCLHIGARSNNSMSEFWEKTCSLEELATCFDSHDDKCHSFIITSCAFVSVHVFFNKPNMRTNDESNMHYSKYIFKNFRTIICYDVPGFPEEIVRATKWFFDKELKVDEDGMVNHTLPQTMTDGLIVQGLDTTRRGRCDFICRGKDLAVRGLDTARRAVFTVLTGRDFEMVAGKFRSAWQKGVPPTARRILAVTNERVEGKWRDYQAGLINQTVEEHFHGTSLSCNVSASQVPCQDGNCGVCGISCKGLDPQHIKKNIDFQRFGHGFYLAPNSSKCHDYTQGANGYRAMLLCDVCPGRKYKIDGNKQHLTGPPPGYDSVYGQVGSKLNYPEIVVYRPEAVLPRYIILYEKDGTQHPLSS